MLKKQRTATREILLGRKRKHLELERKALENTPSLKFLNKIFYQRPKIAPINYNLDQKPEFLYQNQTQKTKVDFALSAGWRNWETNTSMTDNLEGISSTSVELDVEKLLLFND